MFKSLLATALVAAVKAEADPFYGYYGALPYAGYAHGYAVAGVPFGSPSGLDPITQGLDPVTQGALPVAVAHHGYAYGKRSAEAEADPYYLGGYAHAGLALPYAGHAVVAGVPFGSSTGLDPITQGLDASTQGYAPYAYGHLGHYYGKRSADPYYLGGYAGYALPYAAHGAVVAGVPFGSSTGLDPITQGLDASTQGYAPYAYGHLGHYLG